MATTKERLDKLYRLLNELPENELHAVERFLEFVRRETDRQDTHYNMTGEDSAWMDSDLSRLGEFEPYDWGPQGPPKGKPIRYVPGVGPVVEGKEGRG